MSLEREVDTNKYIEGMKERKRGREIDKRAHKEKSNAYTARKLEHLRSLQCT